MLAFAALESSLRSKLEHIVERHEELASMLCDSEIVADKSRFLELSREHADLDTVAQAYLTLTKHEADLEGLRELLEASAALSSQSDGERRAILETARSLLQIAAVEDDIGTEDEDDLDELRAEIEANDLEVGQRIEAHQALAEGLLGGGLEAVRGCGAIYRARGATTRAAPSSLWLHRLRQALAAAHP